MGLRYCDKDKDMIFSQFLHKRSYSGMRKQHFHDTHEIYYLIKGQCDYLIEDKLYHIEAGDIVFIQQYKLHSTVYEGDNIKERYLFNFKESYIPTRYPEEMTLLLNQLSRRPIIRFNDLQKRMEVISIMEAIRQYIVNESETMNLQIEFKFKELLLLMATSVEEDYLLPRKTSKAEKGILKVATYLHDHYRENLTLENISEQFFYSPHYLSRKFKDVTGFTLTEYMQAIRVREAQSLLLGSDEKVIEIAEKCGFGSVSQFQRVFKQQCNTTPTAFRKCYVSRESKVV